ncbi:FecR family protein [Sphingomonas sp. MMS24-J13]|uniref:FecR family protein n=1 Tax=Sphingomonas sp. MMS24-J13 TaxID=3238686 RepID=UPI00384D78F2
MDIPGTRRERIEQEAADWLAALDTGQADKATFDAWRAADPAHLIAFIRVESAWRKLDRLRHAPDAAAMPTPVEDPRRILSRRRAMAVAATAAAALTTGSGLFVATRTAAQTVETAVGERRRFYVAEHVCLDLNTASRLRWWITKGAFEIELQCGELSLDLGPGAPRCTLDAGQVRLWIDHGRCIARLRPGEAVDVVALTGAVHLMPGRGAAHSLIVPERAKLSVLADATTIHALSDHEIQAATAWQEGELLLDGEPLSIAVAEFNRYLPTPIVLETPEIGRLRLGGRFLTNDPTEFLKALRINFGIHARMGQHEILLGG